MTSARIRGLLALVALAFAPVRRARAEEPAQWHYVVDVAPDLSRLDVHVEFANFLPKRLALAGGGALDAVTVHEADGADVEVQREERAVRLDAVDTHGGLRYSVDLAAAAKARGGVTRTGEDLVTHLFNEVAPRYKDRKGGYTRLVKTGTRRGDGAQAAVLMLVE